MKFVDDDDDAPAGTRRQLADSSGDRPTRRSGAAIGGVARVIFERRCGSRGRPFRLDAEPDPCCASPCGRLVAMERHIVVRVRRLLPSSLSDPDAVDDVVQRIFEYVSLFDHRPVLPFE